MARAGSADLPDGESKIFFARGLDSDLPVGRRQARRSALSNVIPGRAKREPRIHNHDNEYGFRAVVARFREWRFRLAQSKPEILRPARALESGQLRGIQGHALPSRVSEVPRTRRGPAK